MADSLQLYSTLLTAFCEYIPRHIFSNEPTNLATLIASRQQAAQPKRQWIVSCFGLP